MIVEEKQVVREHTIISCGGVPFVHQRTSTWYVVQCDACGIRFERSKGQFTARARASTHRCGECFKNKKELQLASAKIRNAKNEAKFAGTKLIDECGYVQVYVGLGTSYSGVYGSRLREHLKVMQDHLGHPLEKGEVVHHINGDKKDNDLDNLVLMTVQEHNACHAETKDLVFELFRAGLVVFNHHTKRYERASCDP